MPTGEEEEDYEIIYNKVNFGEDSVDPYI